MSDQVTPLKKTACTLGLLLLISATLVGCGSTEPLDAAATVTLPEAIPSPSASLQSQASIAVDALLKKIGSVAFVSHDGRSTDAEGRLTLTLLPEGIAKVVYDGAETETTSGNYQIDASGQLQLDFGPNDPWLPMPMTIENERLLVNAPHKEEIIRAAVQAGIARNEITDDDLQAAFGAWPLRQSPSPN